MREIGPHLEIIGIALATQRLGVLAEEEPHGGSLQHLKSGYDEPQRDGTAPMLRRKGDDAASGLTLAAR